MTAVLPAGRDPAQILQTRGPAALARLLREGLRPLADLVIDDYLAGWDHVLDSAAAQLNAMRGAAALIADALPTHVAERIAELTGGKPLRLLDDDMRPVASPALEPIARLLPADAARQISLIADRLGFDHSDVTTELANAVSKATTRPKQRTTGRMPGGTPDETGAPRHAQAANSASHLATTSFPAAADPMAPFARAGQAAGQTPQNHRRAHR